MKKIFLIIFTLPIFGIAQTMFIFNEIYSLISDYTLNPTSRLYTIYDLSKKYLLPNSTFIEVGCWKGGVTGLVALANKNKSIDYFACDTFTGVTKTSDKDTSNYT